MSKVEEQKMRMGTKMKPCKACGSYHMKEPMDDKHMDYNSKKRIKK